MDEARADEVGTRYEPHKWAQTWSGQRTREKEAGHAGFEVVIQNWGTAHDLEISAKRRCDVVEASQIEAEAGAGDDMICALDHMPIGVPQVELDTIAHCFGADQLVFEKHRHRPFDSLA